MKNILFNLALLVSVFSFGQNFENDFKNEVLNLLKADKYKSDNFLNTMSILSQNFYKNIQSEFTRNKYIKELDTDLKMDLKKVYLEKKAMVGDFEKLFNEANSRGFIVEYDSAIASLSAFYDKWYESQLQSLEYFKDFALIFDYCEFDYNPDSTVQMFTFYTQKCLDNYNSKVSKMTQQLNYDEKLRTELKSIFNEIIDFTEPNKIIEQKTAKEYFDSGYEKAKAQDYYGAISDFTKAIELNPNYTKAYINKGYSKYSLGDLTGACADYKKAGSLGHTASAKWVASNCN